MTTASAWRASLATTLHRLDLDVSGATLGTLDQRIENLKRDGDSTVTSANRKESEPAFNVINPTVTLLSMSRVLSLQSLEPVIGAVTAPLWSGLSLAKCHGCCSSVSFCCCC